MKHLKTMSKAKRPAPAVVSSNPIKAFLMKIKGSPD